MSAMLPCKFRPWIFSRLGPREPEGRNLAAGNFRREGWEIIELFVREYFQNVLDNRAQSEDGKRNQASVKIRIISPKSSATKKYISECTKSLEPHLKACGNSADEIDYSNPTYLILEEEGTTGIGGKYDDSRASSDWAAFFHGEAKETKGTGKNGRAGQGKATYHMVSYARSVLVYTQRECDKKSLLMGKCMVQGTHSVGGNYYHPRAFWSEENGEQPVPFDKKKTIDEFKKAFDVQLPQSKPGTAFVIPFPVAELSYEDIIRVTVQDFFVPVLKDRLIVDVGGQSVTKDNFFSFAEKYCQKDGGNSRLSIEFLKFVERCLSLDSSKMVSPAQAWNGERTMAETTFSEKNLELLRDNLADEKIVWVRFPIVISPKDKSKQKSYFDVYLKSSDELKETEEAYIRNDLYIGKEKKLFQTYGKSFGLVLAEDGPISDFLGDAEEASHLCWNAKEEKVIEKYRAIGTKLRIVRTSLPKLYRLLRKHDTETDETLLNDFLAVSTFNKRLDTKKKVKKDPESKPPGPPIPPTPIEKYFKVEDVPQNGIAITSGDDLIPLEKLPVKGTAKVAYENIKAAGDAFKHYHPFDFDLADSAKYMRSAIGAAILSAEENIIEFEIQNQKFELSVCGFNEIKRVITKVKLEV